MYLRGCCKFSCLSLSFIYRVQDNCGQFCAPQYERHGASGVGPAGSSKDDGVTGTSLLWGKTEGAGPVQAWEEMSVRGPHQCLSGSEGRVPRGCAFGSILSIMELSSDCAGYPSASHNGSLDTLQRCRKLCCRQLKWNYFQIKHGNIDV